MLLARGSHSHAACTRTHAASIRTHGSHSQAACDLTRLATASATQARAHLGHHDLSRDVVESWKLARFRAPTALGQRHCVRSEQAVCELAHISTLGQASSESAGLLAIQRWQSQAGRAGARQASVQAAPGGRSPSSRDVCGDEYRYGDKYRYGPSDHR